jgi:ActD protein
MSGNAGFETSGDRSIFGVVASFEGPAELVEAVRRLHADGFRRIDAHSPFPIHGMDEALGLGRSKVPLLVLAGGLLGAVFAQWLQWYLSVEGYALNTGGKPLNSPEAFVPITFETTILFASFAAVIGMLLLNGLPRLYHPVFRSKSFEKVSTDGFLLTVEARDPKFDRHNTPALLQALGGTEVELLDV